MCVQKKYVYMGKYCADIGNLLIYLPSGQFIPLMITCNFVYVRINVQISPHLMLHGCICVGILSHRYYVYLGTHKKNEEEEVHVHKSSVSSQEAIKLI